MVIAANFGTFFLTTLVPPLKGLFLVHGFANPVAFVLSGFCCMDLTGLLVEAALLYFVTRPLAMGADLKTFMGLYVGATVMGSLLVAVGPGAYMGPLAGTAAVWTFFTVRNPSYPVGLPFLGVHEAKNVMAGLGAIYFMQLMFGAPHAAAFIGGAMWALVYNNLLRNGVIKF